MIFLRVYEHKDRVIHINYGTINECSEISQFLNTLFCGKLDDMISYNMKNHRRFIFHIQVISTQLFKIILIVILNDSKYLFI